MKKQYLLIGDVERSRDYEAKELWTLFNKTVDKANKNFKSLYPLTITLGDEFQSVVESISEAKEIIKFVKKHMAPVSLRFVIVPLYGDLSLVSRVPSHYNPLNTKEMMVAQGIMKSLKKSGKRLKIKTRLHKSTLDNMSFIMTLDYTDPKGFDLFGV